MEVFEAIYRRHSYRDEFTDDHIPKEDLICIVEAGIHAPSGNNAQTTSFVIIDDPEIMSHMTHVGPKLVMTTAKAMIACITDKEPKEIYYGMHFSVEDCAAAVENMLLVITALGYATVWIDGALRMKNRANIVNAILNIPEDKTVRVLLPLGRPQKICTQKEKKPFYERAWFNKYGT